MPTASVQAVGTLSTGTGTCTPGVPTGTADGSLLVAAIGCLPDGTITTPTGYTNKILDDDQAPGIALHYKKLTAPETLPTAMSCGGTINNGAGIVLRVEDEDTASDPFWTSTSTASNGAGSTTSPSVSLGSDTPAGLLVWVMAAAAARDLTTLPTGFTRHTPTGTQRVHVCTKTHTGGSTGSVTGVISSGSGMTAGLALIKNATEIAPTGIASTAALGSATVTPGAVTIAPGGIAPTAATGTPTVTPGAVNITPDGIASTTALGSPTVTPGEVTLTPTGIATTATPGTPTLTPGAVTTSPSSIAPTSALGSPTVTPEAVTITPTGIGSTTALGTPVVTRPRDITATATLAPSRRTTTLSTSRRTTDLNPSRRTASLEAT